ncbi:hypothetical protein [Bosea sp. ASV33]|uniref:hypothetical protein n=1 Tax=Bosea sp. ASV33 TaxID=2795106 RepID=UPI0018EA9621|nr:hypothetical protein [Bosea sp. ASV33]
MDTEHKDIALDDATLDAVNGGGIITERTLVDPTPFVRIGKALSEMGGLLKDRFFGSHLVHYED